MRRGIRVRLRPAVRSGRHAGYVREPRCWLKRTEGYGRTGTIATFGKDPEHCDRSRGPGNASRASGGPARPVELRLPSRMRRGSFVVIAVTGAILLACGGNVTSSQRNPLGASGSTPAARGNAPEAGVQTIAPPTNSSSATPPSTSSAASTPTAPNTGTTSAKYDCSGPDIGASAPDQFAELDYELQSCGGPGSDCVDFLVIRADCSLSLQHRDQPHDATASPEDCAALARWATSDLIARAFDDLAACSPGAGNPPEMTEIRLVNGPGPRKKTGLCTEEPYLSHRACMASVRAKYFPGI